MYDMYSRIQSSTREECNEPRSFSVIPARKAVFSVEMAIESVFFCAAEEWLFFTPWIVGAWVVWGRRVEVQTTRMATEQPHSPTET